MGIVPILAEACNRAIDQRWVGLLKAPKIEIKLGETTNPKILDQNIGLGDLFFQGC